MEKHRERQVFHKQMFYDPLYPKCILVCLVVREEEKGGGEGGDEVRIDS